MTTSHLIGHLRVLWRTERIVTELRLKRLLTNLGLQALAALIAACALLLFELAAYFAMVQRWDAIWSAIALGFSDLVLAGLVVLLARRRPATRELVLADDIYQQALTAFETDLRGTEPNSIQTAIESVVVPMMLPLIPLVIQRLRKHLEEGSKDQAA
jgi:hypothetical protein